MARHPHHTPRRQHDEPSAVSAADVGSAPAGPPGVQEVPPFQPVSLTPDPADYLVPPGEKLTAGELSGLHAEGIEAYLYGQRNRYDRSGRLWTFTREAIDNVWSLVTRCQSGPLLLAESRITLDRMPSADGEKQYGVMLEAMNTTVEQAQEHARAEQAKVIRERAAERPEPGR